MKSTFFVFFLLFSYLFLSICNVVHLDVTSAVNNDGDQNEKLDHKHNHNLSQDISQTTKEPETTVIHTKSRKFRLYGFGVIDNLLRTLLSTIIIDPDVLKVFVKTFSLIIWSFIGLSVLGTAGIDTKPMLSLLSVVGITIGLAAKDILTNTFAGLLIILTSPFKRGWIISVEGQRGKVIGIDTRYVRLQRDRSEILVPLSLIYKSTIIIEKRDS